MRRGISNFQIENEIKNIKDEDLDDNFVGVFPSNYINKFIYLLTMQLWYLRKKANIPSL